MSTSARTRSSMASFWAASQSNTKVSVPAGAVIVSSFRRLVCAAFDLARILMKSIYRVEARKVAPSPRLPSGRSRPSATGYGEGRGEGAFPQAQTRGEAPPTPRPPSSRGDPPPPAGGGGGRGGEGARVRA